jgi:hypothetical protein
LLKFFFFKNWKVLSTLETQLWHGFWRAVYLPYTIVIFF